MATNIPEEKKDNDFISDLADEIVMPFKEPFNDGMHESGVFKSILKFKWRKEIEEHAYKMELASTNDLANDGSLQATIEQMLLSVMYGAFSGDASPIPPPLNQTVIPLLSLAGGAVSQTVMKGLTEPASPEQYVDALAEFSIMADLMFQLTPGQNDVSQGAQSGSRLSQVWSDILQASASTTPQDPSALEQYKKLQAQLWEDGTINPITGVKSARRKSDLYSTEQAAQLAYLDARVQYINTESELSQLNPEKWSQLEPIERMKVNMKFEDWIASGKNEVAQILAQMDNLLRGNTSQLITQARQLFTAAENASKKMGTFHPIVFTPSDVFSPESSAWVKLETTKGANYSKIKQTAFKAGASVGLRWGLWGVNAGGSHSKDTYEKDTSDANATVELEYCRVNISRPWMATNWMKANDWFYGSSDADTISKGTVASNIGQTDLVLPSYPIAFIMARNVVITAQFSSDHIEQLKETSQGSTSVGWGPFKVGGSFSSSKFEETKEHKDKNGKITITGPIIIAYVVETLPTSAPMKKEAKEPSFDDIHPDEE